MSYHPGRGLTFTTRHRRVDADHAERRAGAFQRVFGRLASQGQDLSPAELTLAIGEIAPVLAHRPGGVFAQLALIAGKWVDLGGSPRWLARVAPARETDLMAPIRHHGR